MVMLMRSVLLLLLFCLLPTRVWAQANWTEYLSQEGNFALIFPSQPIEDDIANETGLVHQAKASQDGITYYLIYTDLPSNLIAKLSPSQIFDLGRESLTKTVQARRVVEEETDFIIYPGRIFKIETPTKQLFVRSYLVKDRLYQLSVEVPKDSLDGAKATIIDKFFDSFKLLASPVSHNHPLVALREFSSAAGNFTVNLPSPPSAFTQSDQINGQPVNLYGFSVPNKNLACLIAYLDLPENSRSDQSERLFKTFRDILAAQQGLKVLQESSFTFAQYSGREIMFEKENKKGKEDNEKRESKSLARTRFYLINQRLYILLALADAAQIGNASDFFGSFKLLNPDFDEPLKTTPPTQVVEVSETRLRQNSLETPAPNYPSDAGLAPWEGDIVINLVIDTQGNICRAKVVSGGPWAFQEAAMAAVAHWKFNPITINDQPVNISSSVTLHFKQP